MQTAAKPLVYSYTLLSTYNICPHQCWRRFIRKDIPFKKTKAMDEGIAGHSALEFRISGQKPLPLSLQRWESYAAALDGLNARTELSLGITIQGRPTGFFDSDVWF